jgi:hypothetical protein
MSSKLDTGGIKNAEAVIRVRINQRSAIVSRETMIVFLAIVSKALESFKEFPPRAKAASFTVNDVMEKITAGKAAGQY